MLRLSAEFTVDRCEASLRELQQTISDEYLVVPTNSKHAHLGGDAAVVQLIISWVVKQKIPRLVSFAMNSSQTQEFVGRLHGLIATLCSDEIIGFGTSQNLKEGLKQAAFDRLDLMQGPQPLRARGMTTDVICADHLGRKSPTLLFRRLETGNSEIRQSTEFRSIARRLVALILPSVYASWLLPNEYEAIGQLIYEMFKNTEDHALFGHDGKLLDISFRGVTVRHQMVSPKDLLRRVGDMKGLLDFCARTRPPYPGAENLQFIEISVFDSGPGYAARLRRKDVSTMTVNEEFDAVFDCFHKNLKEKGDPRFGQGLPIVVELLKRHRGFVRLRTGRLSLYADPAHEMLPGGLLHLRDTSGSETLRLREKAQGVLATFILPMSKP